MFQLPLQNCLSTHRTNNPRIPFPGPKTQGPTEAREPYSTLGDSDWSRGMRTQPGSITILGHLKNKKQEEKGPHSLNHRTRSITEAAQETLGTEEEKEACGEAELNHGDGDF